MFQRSARRARRVGGSLMLAVASAIATPVIEVDAASLGPAAGRGSDGGGGWLRGPRPQRGPGRWRRELDARRHELRTAPKGSPIAIAPLLGFLDALDGEIARPDLDAVLTEVERGRRYDPAVRSWARYLSAQLAERSGEGRAAATVLASEGYLLAWSVLGPFDDTGRTGVDRVDPPEASAAAAGTGPIFGKVPDEPLSWRPYDYESLGHGGYVSFDEILHPNTQAVGYASTWIRVDTDQRAVLHLGTGGPYKAWIDGRLVARGGTYRAAHPLQEAFDVELSAGWHRLLIKVAVDDGPWGLFARISTPAGGPVAGLTSSVEPQAKPAMVAGDRVQPSTTGLRARLEALRASKPRATRAAAGLALLELYRHTHPFAAEDTTAVALARDLDRTIADARSAWALAELSPDSEGRAALSRGIERARRSGAAGRRWLAPMLIELAHRARALGLEHRARDLIDEAIAAAPDDALVELELVDRLEQDGFPARALQWVRDLAARHPHSESVTSALVERCLAAGFSSEAFAALDRLEARFGRRRGPEAERVEALVRLGRIDEAVEHARRSAAARPGLPAVHVELARLEEARGDLAAARAALGRATALAPQNPRHHARLGELLSRMGERTQAVASLRRSLALRPAQPEIRDLLGAIDAPSRDDLFARWAVDLRRVGARPTPASWRGKGSGVLHALVATRVLDNGLSERLDHRIVRILDERGLRSESAQRITFDPDESIAEVRRARVLRKDGTVVELGQQRVLELVGAGYRMYYDQRQLEVAFPGLAVGDTLEVAFVVRDTAAHNKFDDYFGALWPIQGFVPRAHVEFVLEAPASRPLAVNRPIERTRSKDGKSLIYRFRADDVPAIKPEPGMPGWTEVAQFLHVSTFSDWTAVGRFYWNLVREQLVVDEHIAGDVRRLVAGLPPGADERARVRAIYRHVVRNTRYVGLEFGIHGHKPYRTTDVYERRFGDCKDKASLLKVMLAEAGVRSHLVLVRTRDQGRLPSKPASLAAFNHAIVWVPSLDLYLDGTAEWSGPEELPGNDQGATVLIVRDGAGAELRTIPVSTAATNAQNNRQRVVLDRAGAADIAAETEVRGTGAAGLRHSLQSEAQRREQIAAAWGRAFAGAEVGVIETPEIDDILRPVRIRSAVTVPGFARREGETLRFRALGRGSTLVQALAPLQRREHDLVLDYPSSEHDELELRLPADLAIRRTPAERRIDRPIGRFELKVAHDDDGARVISDLEIRKSRISAAEYPAFRDFLREVDLALEQFFELEPRR